MALVDVQATVTEALNVLPDTESKTEMVALKLAERSFLSIWKVGLLVEPKAASNCVFVQRSNLPIKTSALLKVCLLTVFCEPSTNTKVSIQPSGLTLSKSAWAAVPWNLNTKVVPD